MMTRTPLAVIAGLLFAATASAADDVKEIDLSKTGFKATGRPMTTVAKPTEITTAEELEKAFPAKETVEAIAKEVEFGKQKLLFFAWSGSGQDKLAAGEIKDGEVTFNFRGGLTRDLRSHFKLFAVPKDAKWTLAKGK
jgi:hypothetical protein